MINKQNQWKYRIGIHQMKNSHVAVQMHTIISQIDRTQSCLTTNYTRVTTFYLMVRVLRQSGLASSSAPNDFSQQRKLLRRLRLNDVQVACQLLPLRVQVRLWEYKRLIAMSWNKPTSVRCSPRLLQVRELPQWTPDWKTPGTRAPDRTLVALKNSFRSISSRNNYGCNIPSSLSKKAFIFLFSRGVFYKKNIYIGWAWSAQCSVS